jgi:N-acetylmuramoyl-L-alanine amidase
MTPICVISIGHAGRTPPDRGATFEGFYEIDGIRAYAAACAAQLRTLGWRVEVREGKYATAKAEADALGAVVYLNAHINAGMSGRADQRGEIFYDYQSKASNGLALAASIADKLDDWTPYHVYPKSCRPDSNGKPRDSDYQEAYGCIRGVRAVAICSEPFFLDGAHREQLRSAEGLARIGVSIADGIDAWYKARP